MTAPRASANAPLQFSAQRGIRIGSTVKTPIKITVNI